MTITPAGDSSSVVRIHRAALIEDAVHEIVERRLRGRGWKPYITAYTGYGAPGWARVMARVLLSRPGPVRRRREKVRGWRSFTTTPVSSALVRIEIGGTVTEARTDRSGYLDCLVKGDLDPGWGTAKLSTEGTAPIDAPIRVIDPTVKLGVISDIDDTVMVTTLPRPLLAAWNTFVLDEHARAAVPGMAVLYERLVNA
ncbi:phosphatase domain-containing protein, partial [Actinoplanes sp. NPDC049802]|uniref:phosphatase domain-containing protein n=1 Tax=Actinoplanes sp. NPDC049802 TaxID=3154742 RepID=UPI003406746E